MSSKVYRSSLYPKLASMNQLQTADNSILNNSIAQQGRVRFNNVMNSIIQRNQEQNAANPIAEEANARSLNGSALNQESFVRRESFELPNVVEENTRRGRLNKELDETIANTDFDKASHSGHLNTSACQPDPMLEMKKRVITIALVIIVILLLFAFFNMHILQTKLEQMIDMDLNEA